MSGDIVGGEFIRISIQDYGFLDVTVAICATLVNTQTDRQTDFDRL